MNLFRHLLALAAAVTVSGLCAQTPPDSLVAFAREYIGTPYGYGRSTGKRFDCSGFTVYVFDRFGYSLPRSSREQYLVGDEVASGEWRTGDLVFFSGRAGGTRHVGHVGIVVGVADDGRGFDFIHASTSRGVIVSRSSEPYYASRYVGAKRLLEPLPQYGIVHTPAPLTPYEKIVGRLELHELPDVIKPFKPTAATGRHRRLKSKRKISL